MAAKPIGLISIDAKTLYDRLIASTVGDLITYDELSGIIGRDVRRAAVGAMYTARRRALRENGVVFGTVSGEGLRRLSDVEIVHTGEQSLAHIRRTARRAGQRITAVKDFDALPNEAKVMHNTYASYFGVITHMSNSAQIKKIQGQVQKTQASLPFQKTLEAFK